MKDWRPTRTKRAEAGIALLISIFILMLISVVAIALIVASGTESALAGNYRSSTGVYYAALAGLEEARGRLLTKNPNSFNNTAAGFLPAPGSTLPIGSVGYVLNPRLPETAGNILITYPDTEYATEFGVVPNSANVTTTLSIWKTNPLNALPFSIPLYKWVRINAVSEQSLNLLVAPYNSGPLDSTTPVFYDGAQLNISSSGAQVLEITSLAVLSNGSQKLVQYLAAPTSVSLSFPAALTLDSNNVSFTAPNSPSFFVNGNDQFAVGSCTPGPTPVEAIGVLHHPDFVAVVNGGNGGTGIPNGTQPHYTGAGGNTPNVASLASSLAPSFQTVAGLNALVQTITQSADAVITGPATQANLPSGMSALNPMTIVVNGDLNVTGWHGVGYGLLLVSGTFTYDPDATWNGIVLIIGRGSFVSTNAGTGQFNGAMLIANTLNPPNLGAVSFSQTGASPSGSGVYYSSCWIQAAQPAASYKILAFHEISQ